VIEVIAGSEFCRHLLLESIRASDSMLEISWLT
jgi:hypothetical protein